MREANEKYFSIDGCHIVIREDKQGNTKSEFKFYDYDSKRYRFVIKKTRINGKNSIKLIFKN